MRALDAKVGKEKPLPGAAETPESSAVDSGRETVLLAWNPRRWTWGNLKDEISELRRKGNISDRWSIGNRKLIGSGARFFLIRLGVEPRGLVGSGWTTSEPVSASHWDVEKARHGAEARYVDVCFDTLREMPLVSMEELARPPFRDFHWSTQMSGVSVPQRIADALEALWTSRADPGFSLGRDELSTTSGIAEGNLRRVYVNVHERSAKARALCLAHYKLRCICCDALLRDVYGIAAEDLIQVHHLLPLSEVPPKYVVDPIRDLRPICPNCHAVIHSRRPQFTVEDVQRMIAGGRTRSDKE